MMNTQNTPTAVEPDGPLEEKAKRSVWLGIASILLSPLPLISFPFSISGIIQGRKGIASLRHTRARIGKIFSLTGLILGILSSLFWLFVFKQLQGPAPEDLILGNVPYIDTTYGFKIVPPLAWNPTQANITGSDTSVIFTAPKSELVGGETFPAVISVRASRINDALSKSQLIKQAPNHIIAAIQKHGLIGTGISPKDIEVISSDGIEAPRFSFMYTKPGRNMKLHFFSSIILGPDQKNIYTIIMAAPLEHLPKYQQLFEQVLGTFETF